MAGSKRLIPKIDRKNTRDEDGNSAAMSLTENVGAKERHDRILTLVRERGFVSIDALARHFSVTTQTVRRDINKLCKSGELRRYHGGAGLPSSVENVSYTDRQIMKLEEKKRIAQTLVRYIPDKASLFINIGTTTEEVAKALLNHSGLRIITNNINVAKILSSNESFEVIITGGVVRGKDWGVMGEATLEFIQQFKVDFGIVGISGVDYDGTLLDFDFREVRAARAIIDNSRKVYLAADYSKFGRNAMVRLGHITEMDAVFTDRTPPANLVGMMATADVALHVAD